MNLQKRIGSLRFGLILVMAAAAGLGLFALSTRGSSAPEDPPCAIGAFDLGPNGEEMAGPAVPPGTYKLYKRMKGGAWMTSKPFELPGGHRYLFNASACLTEDGGAASFSQDPAFTKPYSKALADEAIVHYQNTDMTNWIALTVCPVPGSGGDVPPCVIDTTDMIAGIESPGRILAPGKYKLYAKVKGNPWISSAPEDLRGGHRYLVDVTRLTDKSGAGFREDDAELGRYSKPNPDEVVVHYKNPIGSSAVVSATVCMVPGSGGEAPPCVIDTGDQIAGIESPGRMIPPGTYILYSKVKGKAWVSSAPGDLRGGHRYLVDISRQTQDGSPGFSEDDVALLKYDKPNAGEVVVHYKTPMGISDPISATVCVQGAIPVTPTVEGTKITIKTAGTDCLDLIFVIDLTGSMGDDIAQVKRTALDILNTIKGSFANFRVGFVGYKDWSDSADIFKDMPFTNSFDDITALINGLTTGGGGDEPEAVLEALLRALRMPWRNGCNKQIILMGDAPPHDPILKGPDAGKTASDVVQLAKDVDPAVINSIVISKTPGSISEDARKSFEDLAKRTGGIMTTADKAEEVPLKIKEVVGVIKATAAAAPPVALGGGGGPVLPAVGLSPAVIAAIVLLGAAFILMLAIVIVRRRGASPAEPVGGGTGSRIQAGLDVAYADGGIKPFRITSARTTIGRGPDNLLVLRDTQISTHHAEILASPDGFLLRDLESANGTTVNGQPVTEAYLKIGDDIGIGTTHLTFTE